jgi:hypothetical protein
MSSNEQAGEIISLFTFGSFYDGEKRRLGLVFAVKQKRIIGPSLNRPVV